MANFDFDLLRQDIREKTGYILHLDYGEIGDDVPYREVNTIVTPIVGVFRLTPVPLTALTTPYIAVVTATIDIPAPSEMAHEVRDKLNEVAATLNATTTTMESDGTQFTVVYGFETAVLGDKRRDVSLYGGEIIPVTQTITYTIIEQGITALDVSLKIDGLPVPFIRLDETRLSTSETAPNADGHGEIAVTQEMYGLTFETPLVKNRLGDLLCEILAHGGGNTAHAVEVTRNGKRHAYLMAVGSATSAMNPPANVGVTISLAELNPTAAKFNDVWLTYTAKKTITEYAMETDGVIVWGDGTTSCGAGYKVHVYADGLPTHEVYILNYEDAHNESMRYAKVTKGVSLFRKKIRPIITDGSPSVAVNGIPTKWEKDENGMIIATNVITMDSGDRLYVTPGGVLTAHVGVSFAVSKEGASVGGNTYHYFEKDGVTCILRGKVTAVNTDLIEYDRWATTEEV